MPKPLRAHFHPETITITSSIEVVRGNGGELRKWTGEKNGSPIVCWIPDWVTFENIAEDRIRRQPESANRTRSEKAKAQWQQPLDDVKAAGIKIKGKRPTKAEARNARQKLNRRSFVEKVGR